MFLVPGFLPASRQAGFLVDFGRRWVKGEAIQCSREISGWPDRALSEIGESISAMIMGIPFCYWYRYVKTIKMVSMIYWMR